MIVLGNNLSTAFSGGGGGGGGGASLLNTHVVTLTSAECTANSTSQFIDSKWVKPAGYMITDIAVRQPSSGILTGGGTISTARIGVGVNGVDTDGYVVADKDILAVSAGNYVSNLNYGVLFEDQNSSRNTLMAQTTFGILVDTPGAWVSEMASGSCEIVFVYLDLTQAEAE